jgi:phosphohistidine phosphatase
MRHAKSDWADGSLSDHDRALNTRGLRDAPRMADWLSQNDLIPDLILCSSAVRTQETAQGMLVRWGASPTVFPSKRLYLASPQTIFSVVSEDSILPDEDSDAIPQTVLVLAHNPGISEAAGWLTGQMIAMPTAAVVAFDLSTASWDHAISPETARCLAVMKPKALGDDNGMHL